MKFLIFKFDDNLRDTLSFQVILDISSEVKIRTKVGSFLNEFFSLLSFFLQLTTLYDYAIGPKGHKNALTFPVKIRRNF